MVRAILDGRKTQTRRVVKPQPPAVEAVRAQAGIDFGVFTDRHARSPAHFRVSGPVWAVRNLMGMGERESPEWICPYGAPGDRLWVREAWRPVMETWRSYVEYGAGGEGAVPGREALEKMKRVALRFPGARKDVHSEAWHPSIHMPRWASRITLTVEAVRVERLQDISEEDARAEGVDPVTYHFGGPPVVSYRDGFEIAWRSINGADSWQANPWVWVINFSRVEVTRG